MLSDSGSCERVALALAARTPATMRRSSSSVSASPWPRASGGSATPRSTSGAPLSSSRPSAQPISRSPIRRASVASPGTTRRRS
jgi:hypothetical protein